MKRLELSVKIEVPDSLFEAADVVSKIKEPWAELLSSLELSGLKFEHHEGEGNSVAAPVRRGRKPRQRVHTIGISTPYPPDEAA